MKEILRFEPDFNMEERTEIKDLCDKIWGKLVGEYEPTPQDEQGISFIVCKSIKVQKQNDEVAVLDTTSEPYNSIYNRYILRLILGNILD